MLELSKLFFQLVGLKNDLSARANATDALEALSSMSIRAKKASVDANGIQVLIRAVRSVRVKSSAELDEEMMAKLPKFKARSVSKKFVDFGTSVGVLRLLLLFLEFLVVFCTSAYFVVLLRRGSLASITVSGFFCLGASVLRLASACFGCIMSSDKLESFHIRFTGKNYSAWAFQFQLFIKGKELWGHLDGSVPAPRDVEALSKWEIKDARVMTWILGSVEPHLVLNLRPYKTATDMWNYLNTVYNQDHSTRRFQLEYEMANFTQGSLSIEEYYSGFQNLWADYSDIVYASVPAEALAAVQTVHATSKRDQFLMKL
ncbi:hypothetical protein HHK36_012503 [Tetracentron sinense]|uniref:Retrotransposon gag domain-containing protein n=1 Tax=Tetracentron sinense TaxID=13715 RepID=A0A834Z9C2_TETSI|nr:hypothetical protein HHK36_012503 [Tetracentron sinense]